MKNRRNYYRILHIQPDAPIEVIQASYRTLMGRLRCHPDLGGTHRLATLINNAYQCLSHPQKRAEYDCLLSLKQSKQSLSTASPKYRSGTGDNSTTAMVPAPGKGGFGHSFRCPVCGKFSCSERHTRFPQNDRRVRDRLKKKGEVRYTIPQSNDQYHGELMDLSPNGMQFISKEKIDPFTDIKVGCALLFGTARVTHSHEVLRENHRMYINGLNFIMVEFYKSRGTFLSVKV